MGCAANRLGVTLAHIVDKYNKTCHSTIKIKPIDVKSST